MKLREYLEDHILFLIICIFYFLLQGCLLYFLGNRLSMILILGFIWISIFTLYLGMDYYKKNKRFHHIMKLEQHLDQKYLMHEMMDKSANHEEAFYYRLLYRGNKSMLEHVSMVRREQRAYKEYVEQWVHEIKTPIAAMKLWCENQRLERPRDLLQQLEHTEHYVEQALYYARSDNVENDFHVHAVDLIECIHESLLQNKYLCMNAHVRIEIPNTSCIVYTDEKWVVFILNQLLENAVKYRRETNALVKMSFREKGNKIELSLWDNGLGISAHDLPRVFEKGFTGENGRSSNKHSTGIGLYLCKRLCTSLTVGIQMTSIEKEYTEVVLSFPSKDYNSVSSV